MTSPALPAALPAPLPGHGQDAPTPGAANDDRGQPPHDGTQPRSLGSHVSGQLRALCAATGLAEHIPSARLADVLLGPGGSRPLRAPACWPSEVSDDHTPAELSVEFGQPGRPTLRLLTEPIAERPGGSTNARAALHAVNWLADRLGYPLDQFDAVRRLFLPADPQGFALWLALLLRPGSDPKFKVYFNPAVRGRGLAPRLVAGALARLGYGQAYPAIADRALQRRGDHFSFFSLDLGAEPARVKVYVAHHAARTRSLELAASVVAGADAGAIGDFCRLAGGASGPFAGRPVHSAYSLTPGDVGRPRGYTLYFPIRDYVTDDAVARARVQALMACHGHDPAMLDRAISAVTKRPLEQGTGLIAYVSLRLGAVRPGLTVYLSSEAYQAQPARPWHSLAMRYITEPADQIPAPLNGEIR